MVNDGQHRANGENDEPKPEENVDLFVDDVDGQNADGIMNLDGSRSTVFAESTFRYSWKDRCHWIDTPFRVGLQKLDSFPTVSTKRNIKK